MTSRGSAARGRPCSSATVARPRPPDDREHDHAAPELRERRMVGQQRVTCVSAKTKTRSKNSSSGDTFASCGSARTSRAARPLFLSTRGAHRRELDPMRSDAVKPPPPEISGGLRQRATAGRRERATAAPGGAARPRRGAPRTLGAERAARTAPARGRGSRERLPGRRADALVDRGRRAREPRGVDVVAVQRGRAGEPGQRLGDVELIADVAGEREAVEEPAPRGLAAAAREVQPRVVDQRLDQPAVVAELAAQLERLAEPLLGPLQPPVDDVVEALLARAPRRRRTGRRPRGRARAPRRRARPRAPTPARARTRPRRRAAHRR